MIFAHGFGCDQNMWRLVTPAFEDEYRIVVFDHVGAGGSDLSAYDRGRYESLHAYADDVLEICRELDLRDVIFVGHSVSSIIGVLAANRQPQRFDRLILIGPSPRYVNDEGYIGGFEQSDIDSLLDMMDRNYIGWANNLAPVIMGNPDEPELGRELTDSFCSTDPTIARQFAEVTFLSDNRADLERVTVPSLVLQVAEDALAPTSVGEFVHDRLAHSELRILRTKGHCPHMSNPDQTIAAMREYLAASRLRDRA
jgi:sigma-B regulation protein RsbQ